MKKILLAGATGSMGKKVAHLIAQLPDCELVGVLAPDATTSGEVSASVARFTQLADINLSADVWIDFTTPSAVYANTKFALEHHMRPIIGTSGLTDEQIKQLQEIARKQKMGGIIVPNFGLSAVLLMKFAQEAAQYFPDAEVIEMHHADKLDAPSGTASATAKLIAQSRKKQPQADSCDDNPARGVNCAGVPVHAVRLPGYVAHEQVLFGGPGEALTIRQDSFDRSSFMQGVKVALAKIMDLDELIVGLDKIL